jgi:outer membrane protein assembly factor BamB
MPPLRRRTVLAAAATGALVGLAGCSSSCPDTGRPEPGTVVAPGGGAGPGFDSLPGGAWPAPRADAANTGYAPEGAVPTTDLEVRWQRRLEAPTVDDAFASVSSPTVADGRVYLTTGDGVVALDLRTGEDDWSVESLEPSTIRPTHGYDREVVPPVVAPDGTLLVGSREALVALDGADGTERWRYAADRAFGVPAVVDDTVYVSAASGTAALSLADGSELWTTDQGAEGDVPAVAAGTVVVSRPEEVVALAADDGRERWVHSPGAEFYPVVADGLVYVGTYEGLFGLSLADGTREWRVDRGSGRTLSAPTVTPDTLYLAERPGEAGDAAFAFDRTGGRPEPRWCSSVFDAAVPAATDEHALVLQSPGGPEDREAPLLAFTASLGDVVWGAAVPDRTLPPALLDGAVVAVGRDGRVVAVGGG